MWHGTPCSERTELLISNTGRHTLAMRLQQVHDAVQTCSVTHASGNAWLAASRTRSAWRFLAPKLVVLAAVALPERWSDRWGGVAVRLRSLVQECDFSEWRWESA